MPGLLLYKNSVSSATDKELCRFLLSLHKYKSIKKFKLATRQSFPEKSSKVSERLRRLRYHLDKHPDTFELHCRSYNLWKDQDPESFAYDNDISKPPVVADDNNANKSPVVTDNNNANKQPVVADDNNANKSPVVTDNDNANKPPPKKKPKLADHDQSYKMRGYDRLLQLKDLKFTLEEEIYEAKKAIKENANDEMEKNRAKKRKMAAKSKLHLVEFEYKEIKDDLGYESPVIDDSDDDSD